MVREHMMNANRIPIRILGLDPGLRRTGWGVLSIEGSVASRNGAGGTAPERVAEQRAALVARVRALTRRSTE